MKVGTVLAVVFLAAAAIGGTYWVARSDNSAAPSVVENAALTGGDEEPVPSKTGPHPKVVLPEEQLKFGVMPVGETRRHTFVIRNEGEAPLRLGKPVTTCQCTVSESAQDAIPPGGEGTVTLEWTPASTAMNFDKGAEIRTNDPKRPTIQLKVLGHVDLPLRIQPEGVWSIGEVTGDVPTDLGGYVFSRLHDRFAITEIETSNPMVTVEYEPMSEEKLKASEAKTGYRLTAKLAPGMPAGKISETVTIRTDLEGEDNTASVQLAGTRRGPLQVLPLPGTRWDPDAWAVDLERFPAAQGKSGAVSLFVSGLPDGRELKFESIESGEPHVTAELKKDESFKAANRERYVLTFSVAPGGPVGSRRGKSSAVKIEAATNHPEVPSMKFFVQYIATP